MKKILARLTLVFTFCTVCAYAGPLQNVKVVQVEPTVVPNPDKVKGDDAANFVRDGLRNALHSANFELGDSPVRAHIILDEVTPGSSAERVLFGNYGAGLSTVEGHLVIVDEAGREIANVKIRVHGKYAFNGFASGNKQRQQAENKFQNSLLKEIRKLK